MPQFSLTPAAVDAARRLCDEQFARTSAMFPGLVRDHRGRAICSVIAERAARASAEHLAIIVDVGATIFAFDDLRDEGDMTPDELRLAARQAVAARIGVDLAAGLTLLRSLPPSLARPAQLAGSFAREIVALYAVSDPFNEPAWARSDG